jgi:hypothetical protein
MILELMGLSKGIQYVHWQEKMEVLGKKDTGLD